MEVSTEIFKQYKKIIIAITVAIVFCFSSIAVYSAGFSYEVVLNGEVIGYVNDEMLAEDTLEEVLEYVEDTYGKKAYIKDDLVINRVRGFTEEEINQEILFTNIVNNTEVYQTSSVLVVNGEEIIAVDNDTIAKYVLEDILKPYAVNNDGTEASNVRFNQEIEVISKDILANEVLSYDSALLALTPHNNSQDEENSVMRLSSREGINTSIEIEVMSDLEIKETESIDFESVEEKDSSLYVGQKKVKQKGVEGKKELTYLATYTNGEYTSKVLTDEEVVLEPQDEITLIGTKEYTITDSPVYSGGGDVGAIIAEARRHVGKTPYVFGGATPAGFDCSGFTQWVYKAGGKSIPRSSGAQANYGQTISRANLQPGDIVIFLNAEKTAVGHTGLYIGGGRMIHSPIPGMTVIEESINSNYFASRFVSGRR